MLVSIILVAKFRILIFCFYKNYLRKQLNGFFLFNLLASKDELRKANTVTAKTLSPDDGRKKYETMQKQNEALQTEIMNVQIKYQKELEKLEKENRELRQQYLIIKTNRKTTLGKKIKVRISEFCLSQNDAILYVLLKFIFVQ